MIESGPIFGEGGQVVGTSNFHLINVLLKYEYGVLTESEVQANIDAYFAQED